MPKPNDKRGYVYVFRADNGLVKIGRSADWKSRLEGLSVATPYKLEPVYIFECLFSIEQFLHRAFKQQRIRGEWFSLSGAELESIPALVLNADSESGIELSAEELLACPAKIIPFRDRNNVGKDLIGLWPGLLRARTKGVISLFRVTVARQSSTVKFDALAKLKALLTLAAYHRIPKEQIRAALSGVI